MGQVLVAKLLWLTYRVPDTTEIVIEGMENVDKIKKGDQNQNGSVENPDKIISFKSL